MSKLTVHHFRSNHAEHHSDVAEKRCYYHAFNDNHFENRPRARADCLADSKFAGALLDGDEHNVANSDNAAQQCKQPHNPKESPDDVHTGLHLEIVGKTVPKPNRAPVIGGGSVVGVDAGAVDVFKSLVALLVGKSVECKLDASGVVATSKNTLNRGICRKSVGASVFVVLENAHNAESKRAYFHPLADHFLVIAVGIEGLSLFVA